MRAFIRELVSFWKNEDGPTSVEYAVMLALIVVVCLVSITNLGTKASGNFSSVGAKLAGS
jgi:pilus assembly protein Flp/PilA